MKGPQHKQFKLLNICNLKGDTQNSSLINQHNSYILDLVNKLFNGDFSYSGWFKFEYNNDGFLDLVKFNSDEKVTICKFNENEIII